MLISYSFEEGLDIRQTNMLNDENIPNQLAKPSAGKLGAKKTKTIEEM
jgi:hypothetical protein